MKFVLAALTSMIFISCSVSNSERNNGGSDRSATAVPEDFAIEVEHTACFGTCPIYAVRVEATGAVHYHGERFVEAEGARESHVEADAVEDLWLRVQEANFFDLDHSYEFDNPACGPEIADLPSTIIRVTAEGREHEVRRNDGCEERPEGWNALRSGVDRLPEVVVWVGEQR